MTRILFLSEKFPPDIGGLSSSSERISRRLAELNYDVDVLAWSRHLPAAKLAEQKLEGQHERLRIQRLGLYRQWDMSLPATMNVLEWLHQKFKYDAIWGHYLSTAGFLAVWFARMHGIKSIVSARGNDIDTEVFPPGDFSRLAWTLEKADCITAVSKDLAYKIKLISGRNDVQVLANAVDSRVFAAPEEQAISLKEKLGIVPEELVLGFAGELREKKGIQFLFDAFRMLRSERPACLLVIGDIRSQQRPAVQLFKAEFPDDASRLIITGHIENQNSVAEHLSLCDLYLQPSLMEGMPNALLEAMACGALCIASDAGGIPEIIQHGKTGFMLPKAELNHLGTAALEALSLKKEEREAICNEARLTVQNKFSPEIESSQLKALLERLLTTNS
ncbi:MAG: glycosyltransferase [Candidatus Obscuribacterales bacterium]|nr:glycosyltransferase [Candidatus Obscuribacterales bacterium]